MERLLVFLLCLMPSFVYADAAALNAAMGDVRKNCGGLSEQLAHLKTMAGINTAVTGVGTGVGVGAVVVGVAKTKTDQEIRETERTIAELEAAGVTPIKTSDEFAEIFGGFLIDTGTPEFVKIGNLIRRNNELEKKSKTLGNVRTGLMATNTATNIAGAVIAGTNQIKDDLETKIGQCILSVNKLNSVYMQERIQPGTDSAQIARAESIISACGAWETAGADIASVNKRARGAAVSAGIGAGVGLAGTITSGVANSDSVRAGDTVKEQKVNTAANILAGGATAASATATVFNATQIAAVKRVVDVADKCEGVLR